MKRMCPFSGEKCSSNCMFYSAVLPLHGCRPCKLNQICNQIDTYCIGLDEKNLDFEEDENDFEED